MLSNEVIAPMRPSHEDVIDATSLYDLVNHYWKFIAVVVLIFTSAAIAAAFLMTPVYRATVVLLPANSGNAGLTSMLGDIGGLASLAGIAPAADQNTVEAVALLKSRDFTEAFIQEHGLLRRMYQDRWDEERGAWRKSWRSREAPTLYDGYEYFSREIRRVSEDKKTGLVTLQVDWTDASEGAAWANSMVHRLNQDMRQRAIAEADASIQLLGEELRSAPTLELQEAIARAIETHVKARALAKVRPDYAFRTIDTGKPADPDDFVRPQRALYVVTGPVIGCVFALFIVLAWDLLQRQRKLRQVKQ